jgi:hypothetical protein
MFPDPTGTISETIRLHALKRREVHLPQTLTDVNCISQNLPEASSVLTTESTSFNMIKYVHTKNKLETFFLWNFCGPEEK